MKYIKKFKTHSDYEDYLESQDYLTPNVSYCVDQNEIHFEKYAPAPETRIVATFNVTDTSNPTNIVGYDERSGIYFTSPFSEIEIDGVIQNEVIGYYQFDTTGEHIVKYTSYDNTLIPEKTFFKCNNLTTISIPNGVTSIGSNAFYECNKLSSVSLPNTLVEIDYSGFIGCTSLLSVTIPESVTTMPSSFQGCTGLTSITCLPITPPTIDTLTFSGSDCPIYVPAESVSAYQSASGWSTYASRIQAIPT